MHLYEEHGPHFVRELRGMFAVALWDSKRRRLVLARDPFGIKPLYYSTEGGTLAFASELKALPRGEVDLDALEAFLAFNSIPAPLSIWEGTTKLPAGHLLVWDGEGEPTDRALRASRPRRRPPRCARRTKTSSPRSCARGLRDSVRAHLIADVPVGVLLSGGVDSGALAALAALESGKRVQTFSIGFDEGSFDELADARKVAERYDTDHHELVVRPDAAELLPKLA